MAGANAVSFLMGGSATRFATVPCTCWSEGLIWITLATDQIPSDPGGLG